MERIFLTRNVSTLWLLFCFSCFIFETLIQFILGNLYRTPYRHNQYDIDYAENKMEKLNMSSNYFGYNQIRYQSQWCFLRLLFNHSVTGTSLQVFLIALTLYVHKNSSVGSWFCQFFCHHSKIVVESLLNYKFNIFFKIFMVLFSTILCYRVLNLRCH